MKTRLLLFTLCIAAFSTQAQTWNQNIAPIFYEHCGKCHHDGGIAPTSLVTYTDAYNTNYAIMDAINSGEMPPWPANSNYTHFVDENVLSVEDKDAIQNWLNSGMPEGTGTAPQIPSYNDGYQIQSPDQIVTIPAYTVSSDLDVYRSFVMTNATATAFNIDQIEFDPDNTDIVHHILAWYDPSNVPQQLDAADPGPGWTSSGGAFPSDNAELIGVWVPGMGITDFPTNLAINVPAGANFVIEVHFAPGSNGQSSNVAMRLKYKTTPTIRQVYHEPLLYHFAPSLQEPALAIPPDTIISFHEQSTTAPVALSLLSVFPHMHLLGKQFKVYGLTNTGDSIRVIDVEHYDFHWQFSYKFPTLLKLPAGARLYGKATYDNTTDNEDNPNSPPAWVYLGENTTDEMMVCFFMYTTYQNGDENISQVAVEEYTNDNLQRVLCYPNPATSKVYVDYPNDMRKIDRVQLIDAAGRILEIPYQNFTGRMELDVEKLTPGYYQLIIGNSEKQLVSSIVKE